MVGFDNPKLSYLRAWSGAFVGGAAWAASTQLNYSLATMQCGAASGIVPWAGLALALLAAGGGALSATWRRQRHDPAKADALRFAARVSLGLATLFTLTIVLQAAAGLVLGCER